MSTYSIEKLTRSLSLKVLERLDVLLPEAEVTPIDDFLTIKYGEMEGNISLGAMVEACHSEGRELWGAIAGGYCNLVVSRLMSSLVPPLDSSADLDNVWISMVPENDLEDRMIVEATPVLGLLVCTRPWLPGVRLQCDFDGPQGHRRVLHRDLEGLGLSEEQLFECAKRNMSQFVSQIDFGPLGTEGADSRILHLKSAGAAPSVLAAEATHEKLFEWFEGSDSAETGHLVAAIPQTDTLLCCRARDREAAARLVSYAWSIYGDESETSIPLTNRSFSISAPGKVKFEDMGRTENDLKDWSPHSMGRIVFRCPDEWDVKSTNDGHWEMASKSNADGPSIDVKVVENSTSGPTRIHELALAENESADEIPIAFGFFNAIPWARVNSGQADGLNQSKLFVGANGQVLMVTTAIPEGAAMPDIMTMQKVLTSMHSI